MSDDLEVFKKSLDALDINTQTTLRTIATRLDVNSKVEPNTLQLLPSRIEDVTVSSGNCIVLHQTAVGVAETMTSNSGNGRSFEDITSVHSTPRYLRNAELEQRLCKKLAEMDCTYVGFSELFLAVITKHHRRLQAILAEDDTILNISQTDLYGRNILHASCNWPDGLRLLLQRQDALPLMDMAPEALFSLSPLDYALFYSKTYCKASDQWTECDDCTCYVAVQLLLEADCKVTITYKRSESLANCSLKARRLFFKHLKDRRQRLRNIALSILPDNVLRQYGVVTSALPDKTAVLLWSELKQAQDQQDRQVWLPDSLDPCNNGPTFTPESLFEFPHHLQVAELAVDYGFAPRDENGVQPLLSGTDIIPHYLSMRSEVFMKYLNWLLQYDLNLELSLESFQFSILHRLAISIGRIIASSLSRAQASVLLHRDVCISELQDSRTLLPVICDNKAQCNIPCPCSSGIFTRPLALILPAMLRHRSYLKLTHFFSDIRGHVELVISCIDLLKLSECSSEYLYMAKCAFHILAMMSLGIRHLPICLTGDYDDVQDSMGNEDWEEILDEDRELIDQLEALDEEFGDVFDRQNVSISEFLPGYWLTRMEVVIQELHKPLTYHDRYELLEAGVVLEEDNSDDSECCEDMIYV
ncbi:hypothetical protein BFJ72_g7566 [Fusarium proliferatum]|uniref:Uncharacterized protein n=1 Tax=Gibberella intermedia TaxID=948311 RepID=A0A420T998_GIBIN|nr:hypothetical protein BFJ72_g7566 [Fusarium proliferatum]